MPEITLEPANPPSFRVAQRLADSIPQIGPDWVARVDTDSMFPEVVERRSGGLPYDQLVAVVEVVRAYVPWNALQGAVALKFVELAEALVYEAWDNRRRRIEIPIIGPDKRTVLKRVKRDS